MRSPSKISVISVQTRLLGNVTYGMLLRRLFEKSDDIDFRAVWGDETKAFFPRAFNRAITGGGKLGPARRNLDFWATRFELGASTIAKSTLQRSLREFPADVLHMHTQGLAWTSLDLMGRIPTIVSGDMTAVQSAEQDTAPQWRWTHVPRILFERRVFRAANAVVAFSQWAADSIVRDYGVEPSRIHVIHPGILSSEVAALSALPITNQERPFRLLFVGGEFERKGGRLLVEVFLKHFASAGAVLDLVTQSDVDFDHPQIYVHRNIAPFSEGWRQLYGRASLLVVPTLRDASSHVSIEAMAAGLPVVTTTVGGIPEIVKDGETGFLIAPGNAAVLARRLEELNRDPELRARMGAAGRARVRHQFDASVNGTRLAGLYAEVFEAWREAGQQRSAGRRVERAHAELRAR